MILQSRVLMGFCLILASGIHLLGLGNWQLRESTQIAAAGPVAEAKVGSSFADLAMGVLQPAPPVAAQAIQPVQTTDMAVRPGIADVAPVILRRPTVTSNEITQTAAVATSAAEPLQQAARPITPTTVIAAQPETALTRSTRPVARPTDLAQISSAPREGNAQQDATAGANATPREATAPQSGSNATTAARTAARANAAATNYSGIVLNQIARVRRPRTSERGVAIVTFTIGANGSLASVTIARSSGSREVDRLAQQVIRQAAPFPPPPTGARTRWQIEIAGG